MAKRSSIQKNLNRKNLVDKYSVKRAMLKQITMDKEKSIEERFAAQLELAELPRNSARIRLRNRCQITGRPRAYYGRFGLSRIKLREFASFGLIPGLKKSSW